MSEPGNTYDPKGNGKDKTAPTVAFVETPPPDRLARVVHRFLMLRTTAPLEADYRFHALPDACTYAVFDQRAPTVTGLTRLRATSEEFNLGRVFHFVNIRFLPGVWNGDPDLLAYGQLRTGYTGPLPLLETAQALQGQSFEAQQVPLIALTDALIARGLIAPNPVTERLLQNLDDIRSVADMAAIAGHSARQLQRRLKRATGFAPHDLLKVLRLQQALADNDSGAYADQSHFIHSFRKATGYTPGGYARKYDV